jgi:hypothetical protein
MKLVIGAGDRRLPGFKHHDVMDLPGLDIKCEFFDLPKHVKAKSCDEIHMTHVLEHFPMKKTGEVLDLIHDMLAPGGKLYIEVPNFYWHAEQIVKNPLDRQVVEYAFGGQLNEWDFHYNGFTPDILVMDLISSNLYPTEVHPNSSIELWAERKHEDI